MVAAHALRTLAAELLANGLGDGVKQLRLMSLVEAIANVAVGYGVAIAT